jgi:hypothetical protein
MAAVSVAGPSPKKGVGMWSFSGDTQALAAVDATWFYTWSPNPQGIVPPSSVAFVPMLWGATDVTPDNLGLVSTEGSVLLGFNEPDLASQSNLTPGQALALWPPFVATGMRLGSPAPSSRAADTGSWLDTFMKGAAQQGLRVDFICLHWYGGNFDTSSAVSELETYLSKTHAYYGLPIWLTEFALTNYSGSGPMYPTVDQQAAFATAAVTMLEAAPYVERYAWFSLPPCPVGGGNGGCGTGNTTPLALAGGSLTAVGIAYASAGGGDDGGMVDAGTADGGIDAGIPDSGLVLEGGVGEPTSPHGCSSASGSVTPIVVLTGVVLLALRQRHREKRRNPK